MEASIDEMENPPFISIYLLSQPPIPINQELHREGIFSVEIRTGPLNFERSVPIRQFTDNTASLMMGTEQIEIGEGLYLIVIERVSIFNQVNVLSEARARASEIVTMIDLEYKRMVSQKVFDGVVNEPGNYVMYQDGPEIVSAMPTVPPEHLKQVIDSGISRLSSLSFEQRSRVRLMSRWYRRAQETLNQVDKFLYLYVVIEVYPAAGETDVPRFVRDYLGVNAFPNIDKSIVKDRLKLGRITGFRASIVHDGKESISEGEATEFRELLKILECVAYECLNLASGRSYQGSLDEWVSA
jgi:hypothetical protein